MARLPQPGQDAGQWGNILNDYLSTSLAADGSLKADTVGAAQLASSSVTSIAIAPNAITKAMVGLSNVDNTSDAAKPVSTATQSALDTKVDVSVLGAPNGVATLNGSGVLPQAQLPVNLVKVLEGVPATIYGDSQAKNPGQGADVGTQFADRLNGRHRFRTYNNRGVASTTMGEIAAAVTSSWVSNSRGLALVCSGIGNSSSQWGADGLDSVKRAFRTVLATLSSRARFENSSPTFAFDNNWLLGESSTLNSVFDFGVQGDSAFLILMTAVGSGGTLEIRDGTRLVATINTGGYKAAFPGAFELKGLGSGNHILRGKLTNGSVIVSSLLVPSASPAQVVWATVEPSRSNTIQRQSFVDACKTVLTDFPKVLHITPGQGWDPAVHISDEDGLHLNDQGNAFMADRIESELARTLTFSQGLNRLTRNTADVPYTGPIPTPLVSYTTYASDTFDRANGSLGASEVGAKDWTLSVASSVSIVDGAAEWTTASATAGTIAYVDDGEATGRFIAEGVNSQSYGLFISGDSFLNGYYLFHSNGNGWRIGIRTASGFTPLATAGSTTPPSTNVTLSLTRSSAGLLRGYVDGALIVSTTSTTYSGTRHGIISLLAGKRVTSWRHTNQQ
jgi:hypothetical protein